MFQKMRLFRIFSVYFHAVPVCPCHCPHGHPAAEAPTPVPWCPALPPAVCPTSPVAVTGQGRAGASQGPCGFPESTCLCWGLGGTLKDVPPCGRLALPSHGSRAAFVERGGEEFGGAII